jgi:hypothetical protein
MCEYDEEQEVILDNLLSTKSNEASADEVTGPLINCEYRMRGEIVTFDKTHSFLPSA